MMVFPSIKSKASFLAFSKIGGWEGRENGKGREGRGKEGRRGREGREKGGGRKREEEGRGKVRGKTMGLVNRREEFTISHREYKFSNHVPRF